MLLDVVDIEHSIQWLAQALEAYYGEKRKSLSEQTLKHHHALLRKALRECNEEEGGASLHHG